MSPTLLLLVPRNFSRGIGVIPSLAERGGAVLAAYVYVGTTRLECSVLKCGQVYSTLCCLLVGASHSDCITYCTVTVFLIMSCIVHIAIVIWCHALVSVGNVFRSGVALNVTTASVQLRVLYNSAYFSARLKLRGTKSIIYNDLQIPFVIEEIHRLSILYHQSILGHNNRLVV
jgi:hypothetical protein